MLARRSFRAVDGTALAFTEEKDGFPVVALAGLTRDGRDYDYLARHLPDGVRFIRLDGRGRGRSQWTGAATYTVAQEVDDVVALLDYLELPQAAFVGASRGGILGMAMAAKYKSRMLGLCIVDVGPVIELSGLQRISTYVGIEPSVKTLEEIAERMPMVMPGFHHVPAMRWVEEAIRHFDQLDGRLGLPYDPELRVGLTAALSAPLADAWPLFDACEGLPLALIRGENSDLLSRETANEMRTRRPDMLFAEVPDRGHVPFLDEPQALACFRQWLGLMQMQSADDGGNCKAPMKP